MCTREMEGLAFGKVSTPNSQAAAGQGCATIRLKMKHFATKLMEIGSELAVAMCQTGVGRKGIQKSRLIAHEQLVVFSSEGTKTRDQALQPINLLKNSYYTFKVDEL